MAQFEDFDEWHEQKFSERCVDLGRRITRSLKDLLEQKHLYQSIEVDFGPLLTEFIGLDAPTRDMLADEIPSAAAGAWDARDRVDRRPRTRGSRGISFDTPDVKLYCSTCHRIEAFNSMSTVEISTRGIHEARSDENDRTVQVFALSLECQSCKGPPEVVLIQRKGDKLTLSGRAPIEHVSVPSVIPPTVRQWYSGAIVAHQSGQTLAGLFLLRTLIEQWTRETLQDSVSQAVDLLERYKASLPNDFNSRFPSLSDVYSRLSEDIHSARGSADLFEETREGIEKHFDARRVFQL